MLYETIEDAREAALLQAAFVPNPTAIMVSCREGYVTGDGVFHPAGGLAAGTPPSPRKIAG